MIDRKTLIPAQQLGCLQSFLPTSIINHRFYLLSARSGRYMNCRYVQSRGGSWTTSPQSGTCKTPFHSHATTGAASSLQPDVLSTSRSRPQTGEISPRERNVLHVYVPTVRPSDFFQYCVNCELSRSCIIRFFFCDEFSAHKPGVRLLFFLDKKAFS